MINPELANRQVGAKQISSLDKNNNNDECQLDLRTKQQWLKSNLKTNIGLIEKGPLRSFQRMAEEERKKQDSEASYNLNKFKQFLQRSLRCFHRSSKASATSTSTCVSTAGANANNNALTDGYHKEHLTTASVRVATVNVDSGYAWIILGVMFVINASTFGTARAYGLIFEKLVRQGEQTRSQAALPFTIMGAIENMAGPLTGYLLTRCGSWRLTVFIGSSLITLSHLFAALLDSLPGQIISMGFMCGIGQSFVTISSFQINNSYFVRYRSRAFGLGLTGAAFGTLYITPLCQYVLNNYNHQLCYLMLGLILLPNVFLSLLLKQNKQQQQREQEQIQIAPNLPVSIEITNCPTEKRVILKEQQINTISGDLVVDNSKIIIVAQLEPSVWQSIKLIIKSPLFHLIWTLQLLFCWFNFVFGMIIVDFGKDRELDSGQVAKLIPIWAFGQLVGRLFLGSLVDFKLLSYEVFTVICFGSIGAITWTLNNVRGETLEQQDILISILVFTLSMFISNLYILFNGLVVSYMDKSLTALSIGISSFTSSFFLLPRASTIGYYRDTIGNYDAMLSMFTYVAAIAALVWLVVSVYKPKR